MTRLRQSTELSTFQRACITHDYRSAISRGHSRADAIAEAARISGVDEASVREVVG